VHTCVRASVRAFNRASNFSLALLLPPSPFFTLPFLLPLSLFLPIFHSLLFPLSHFLPLSLPFFSSYASPFPSLFFFPFSFLFPFPFSFPSPSPSSFPSFSPSTFSFLPLPLSFSLSLLPSFFPFPCHCVQHVRRYISIFVPGRCMVTMDHP